MGRHTATKVGRIKGSSPLIFQFHCAAPTVPPLYKCLELATGFPFKLAGP